MLDKYQSVIQFPHRKRLFWSVLFPLSIKSSKFSNEVLHSTFELQFLPGNVQLKGNLACKVFSTYSKVSKNRENRWFGC